VIAAVLRTWRSSGRGLITAGLIASTAAFVAANYGGPLFLYALLFGIACNFLGEDERIRPGIDLATRGVLRLGVGLLGARITLAQVATLGLAPVAIVAGAVVATLVAGSWLAARLGRPRVEGLLSGGAVAICGASAALAIAAVLPRDERMKRFTLLVVVGVTALSTLAMILYPPTARVMGLDDVAAAVFLGGTIHDVAQVMGAGLSLSQHVGDLAAVVKLLRVALLVPVVIILSLSFRGRFEPADGKVRAPLLPWFLLLFVALVLANSAGLLPATLETPLGSASRACLVLAIAALGVKTSFQDLATLGWQPIVLLVGETVFLAAFVLGGIGLGGL
jgi:uncharacterized integral membrane protein (TIGR00698 family)